MILSVIASIIVSIFFSVSQPEYSLEQELNYAADFFTIDQLGNIFIVNGSEITKLNIENNKEQHYSNSLNGKIDLVDSSDPFRILLFYRDFNRIVFLDKNLTEITSAVLLDDLNYYNIASVCQSVNGGFWIFDQSLDELAYFDKSLNLVRKSSQLSEMLNQNIDVKQVFMLEKNDYIYLGIKGEGILLFDSYGTYIKTFPIADIDAFQVNNGMISYLKNGSLYLYNTNDYTEDQFSLPLQNCKRVLIENKKMFIQTGCKIFVYKLSKL